MNQAKNFVAVVSTDTDLNTTVEDLPNAMNPSKPSGQILCCQQDRLRFI